MKDISASEDGEQVVKRESVGFRKYVYQVGRSRKGGEGKQRYGLQKSIDGVIEYVGLKEEY